MLRIFPKPAIAFAILLAVTPIAGAATEEPPEIEWGKEVEGVRFSIAPSQPSFRYDQPVKLKMGIKNVTDKSTWVKTGFQVDNHRFDVRLPNGEPAPLTLLGARIRNQVSTAGGDVTKLDPGEVYKDGFQLNRYYDMTPLGEYTVTVHHPLRYDKAQRKWIEVPSNTVKIVVREYTAKEEREARKRRESNESQ